MCLIFTLSGCGSLSANAKMKPDISKNYSDTFVQTAELTAQQDVLLYQMASKDQLLSSDESKKFTDSTQSYFDKYRNANDPQQKEIIQVLKTFYRDYLKWAMNKSFTQLQQDSKETGKSNITNEQMQKNIIDSVEFNKKQLGILKTDLQNLGKYFK